VPSACPTSLRALLCLAVLFTWPRQSHGGICYVAFRAVAHHIGFAPAPDHTAELSIPKKWQWLNRMIPQLKEISPEALDLLALHMEEVSPQRIHDSIFAAPTTPLWEKRAVAELLHLNSLASIGGIRHVRWVERWVALKVLYGGRNQLAVTSPEHITGLIQRALEPDAAIAMGAVMEAGGVAFYTSAEAPAANVRLVMEDRVAARDVLNAALAHPQYTVRAAARRGLIALGFNEGTPVAKYSDAQREEVTRPLRDIRKQERVPLEQRTIPIPEEPDGLMLARHEMDRLPTEVLADFLASRRDASAAGPSLAENRTTQELMPYLDHPFAEVRLGAVEGLAGRFEGGEVGALLVGRLKRIIREDNNEPVRLAAIAVLAEHSEGGKALRSLASDDRVDRRLVPTLKDARERNRKLTVLPSDADVLAATRGEKNVGPPESVDFSHRPIDVVTAALLSNNFAWQKQAVRGLKGRTDLESLNLLAQIMGVTGVVAGPPSLSGARFSSDLRIEALTVANSRNHPAVDRMFEIARSSQESPRVNRAAARLIDQLARATDKRGLLHFRVVSRRLKMDSDLYRQMRDREKMTPEERRLDDHANLLDIANNTYTLPSLNRFVREAGPEGETREERIERIANNMVEDRRRFLEGVPLGYDVEADVGDATTSGLKLYYLRPHEQDPTKPSILSVAGTEKWLDWYSNLTWGVTKRETPAYRRFLGKVVADLLAGRKVQITGHSLGGGMAQYLGYDAARAVKAAFKDDPASKEKLAQALANLDVVTWNAFGVTQVLRGEESFDKELLAALSTRMVHYRTPFDVVSHLGETIGPTATLPYTGWWGITSTHAADNLSFAAVSLGGFESVEPTKKLLQLKPVSNTLARWLAPLGRHLTRKHLEKTLEEHFDILIAARAKWIREHAEDSETLDAWLNAEIHELLTAASKYDPETTRRLGARWEELKATSFPASDSDGRLGR